MRARRTARSAEAGIAPLPAALHLLLVLLIPGCSQGGSAVEGARYAPPALDQFLPTSENDADGDGDGVKETHVRHYRSRAGDRLFSMTTRERLWAWSLQSHAGDPKDLTRNYVIRDSDCDGSFDERFGLDQEYRVPDCLK
jgi:hypothetical protein